MMSKLGFHLETETQLVSGLVQFGAVDVAGESDGDAIPQLLLVTHTNLRGRMEFSGLAAEYCLCSPHLAVGINLGPDGRVLVQSKLAPDGKVGGSADGAAAGNSGLQLGAVLQVDTSTEGLQILLP